MRFVTTAVGLLRCPDYRRSVLKENIDALCKALCFSLSPGDTVLLKPNLVAGGRAGALACTQPEFIAAAAEWCLDQSARVVIGDSPAFGTARSVMQQTGTIAALKGLPVKPVNFSSGRKVFLANDMPVILAQEIFECDVLINLPRVKAHSQLRVSLAIKNFFGTVVGMRKAWWHMCCGNSVDRFARYLFDLLEVLPGGTTLIDGVVAMHESGPLRGRPLPLGIVAGGQNPVALDTALLTVLGIEHARSPLWRESAQRHVLGAAPADLAYPLLEAEQAAVGHFIAPEHLKPISFNPCRMALSAVKRSISGLGG
jgi:uncharacterized protein (DUF362 family)